jgi:ankyrin repeat domain-containing protein 50
LNQETPAKAEATAAQSTKNDLSLTYEKMLSRISPQGNKLLQWVLFATRLLTVEQLRFAIAIEEGMVDMIPRSQLPFSSFLDSALGLLAVDSVDKTVRFAHLTAKDYLAEHTSRYFPMGHSLLARTCLTFFNFTSLSNELSLARFQCDGDLNAFFNYPAFNWGHHVRESEHDVQTLEKALDFLFSVQFQQLCSLRRVNPPGAWAGCESLLHEACFFGLASAIVKLLKLGMNVNVLDSLHRTPLHCAVHHSRLAVVKTLLQCPDIDVNVQDKSGITPLHHAISDSAPFHPNQFPGQNRVNKHFNPLPEVTIQNFFDVGILQDSRSLPTFQLGMVGFYLTNV